MTQKGMDMYHKYRPFYGRDTATVLMALVDNSSAMTVAELGAYRQMTKRKVVKGVVALDEGGIIEEIS